MCNLFGNGAARQGQQIAQQARADEEQRQQRVREGTARVNQTFGQFGEPFFQQRARQVTDFYMPQLDEQYGRARESLIFALANAGTLNSSVATRSLGDLERDYARRRQDIVAQGQAAAQEARGQIEDARSGLVRNLAATGDATGTAAEAATRAQSLSINPSFSPLAQVFGNTAAGIGAGRAAAEDAAWFAERRRAAGTPGVQPGNSSGSGRVIR